MARAATYPRPKLRGVSHRIAFFVALIAGAILVSRVSDARSKVATVIYVVLLAGMFGVSATLHRRDWAPRAYGWLRRADHAMIFACIAGTYTPFCMVALRDSPGGSRLLVLAWGAASLGIVRALLWPHAPRIITSTLFVIVGWIAVGHVGAIHAALDPIAFGFLVAGGVVLTIGAVVYQLRRPDPWPDVFGYHEVFHMIINTGVAFHFVSVARVVTG
jgi:hemolysin III